VVDLILKIPIDHRLEVTIVNVIIAIKLVILLENAEAVECPDLDLVLMNGMTVGIGIEIDQGVMKEEIGGLLHVDNISEIVLKIGEVLMVLEVDKDQDLDHSVMKDLIIEVTIEAVSEQEELSGVNVPKLLQLIDEMKVNQEVQ
jgi:hypothetical protein